MSAEDPSPIPGQALPEGFEVDRGIKIRVNCLHLFYHDGTLVLEPLKADFKTLSSTLVNFNISFSLCFMFCLVIVICREEELPGI